MLKSTKKCNNNKKLKTQQKNPHFNFFVGFFFAKQNTGLILWRLCTTVNFLLKPDLGLLKIWVCKNMEPDHILASTCAKIWAGRALHRIFYLQSICDYKLRVFTALLKNPKFLMQSDPSPNPTPATSPTGGQEYPRLSVVTCWIETPWGTFWRPNWLPQCFLKHSNRLRAAFF